MPDRTITLADDRFEHGAYSLRATLSEDGSLVLEGQDLGAAPEAFWGSREYEWRIGIAAQAVPRLVSALGGVPGENDPLDLLASRYRDDPRFASRGFFDEAGIAYEFWSRVGD
jgi:hypothetical protein